MSVMVSAAGALLWMTHTLLHEHGWVAEGFEGDSSRLHRLENFVGDVNLLPAQRYKVPKMTQEVDTRGLLVGTKFFVHFISNAKSVQISLQVSEFVKPREMQAEQRDGEQGRVFYTDKWRCNLEILRWRLERNLFPEFSSNVILVASDAELSRLPEPLLARVGGFLSVPDFCRVTQTGKYLHQMQDSPELWQWFLSRDFSRVHSDDNPKTLYISQWTYEKRMKAWNQFAREQRLHEYFLRHQAHWRRLIGGRLPAPPLHLPMPPPFQPLRPPHYPGLFDDEDLGILRDPFVYLQFY